MATINTKSVNTHVNGALRTATAYGEHIAALRTALADTERAEGRAALLPAVGTFYRVPIVEGQRGAALSSEAPNYEAAKKALQRLLGDVYGAVAKATPEKFSISRSEREAFKALLSSCDGDVARLKAVVRQLTAK